MSEWEINALISGQFVVREAARSLSTPPIVPDLRSMRIKRHLDKDGKPTMAHLLTAVLSIPGSPAETATDLVNDRASDLVARICSLLALASGRRVKVEGFSAKALKRENPPEYRTIHGAPETFVEAPPVPVDETVFTIPLDSKSRRVVTWWSRGLPPGDTVDRLISLNSALDMLANSLALGKSRKVECEKCGHSRELAPALRDNVLAFLKQAGVSDTDAASIYETRNHLAHGVAELSSEEDRRYDRYCEILLRVIRDALATAMRVQLPKLPRVSFHTGSAHLVVDFEPPAPSPGPGIQPL